MTYLDDLFDPELYIECLETGLVREQKHPVWNLYVANYTERAQYGGIWNDVTRQCRGLIFDGDSRVIARPFPKFFNLGQAEAPDLALDEPVRVFDKLDGSLGILYQHDYAPGRGTEIGLATRGSFMSEQARYGSELLRILIGTTDWRPNPNLTYLVEIIYPENRIVVDYGRRKELVLLEVIETATGLPAYASEWNYPGPWVDIMLDEGTLEDALSLPPRENAEGFVLYVPRTNERVKVKQEDYVRLHAIITNLSTKQLWRSLREGLSEEEILTPIPDEFQPWAREQLSKIVGYVDAHERAVKDDFFDIMVNCLPMRATRKDFALYVQECPYKSLLFRLYDGKPIRDEILKSIEPVGVGETPRVFSEDTA